MKHLLAPILLLTLLFPSLAYGETMDDLVKRDGIHYKKFSTVPFTGKVTGKSQGSFKNGKWDGPWVSYYDNGQLWSKGTFKDGKKNGHWVHYHDNGQLMEQGIFSDDKTQGPWVQYHKNGQLHAKGIFKDGKLDGPWVWYLSDGTVFPEFTGTFKDGVKVK